MVLPAMAPGRDLDPDPPRALSSGTGQEGSAQGISGTWSGTLTGSDGETLPNSEFSFSPAFNYPHLSLRRFRAHNVLREMNRA